jgi:hypothetical protein
MEIPFEKCCGFRLESLAQTCAAKPDLVAALPPDVRKGFAFPADASVQRRGYASLQPVEAEPLPKFKSNVDGKAEPFRTSDGEAAIQARDSVS